MLVIEKPKTHIIRGRGNIKHNRRYVKGRGFVDMITNASKVISPIASTTSDLITVGKNTAEIVSKIRNRFKKKSADSVTSNTQQQSSIDNLIHELKSGRGFQYV